eukprot:7145208-Pyramimonas_sp.AAC.1
MLRPLVRQLLRFFVQLVRTTIPAAATIDTRSATTTAASTNANATVTSRSSSKRNNRTSRGGEM